MVDDDDEPMGQLLRLSEARDPTSMRPPITRARAKPGSYCSHRRTELDVRRRELTCVACGREVDPYAFLGSLMHESDYTDAVEMKRQLGREIEALHKERQRLRDAVNRLKRKGVQ